MKAARLILRLKGLWFEALLFSLAFVAYFLAADAELFEAFYFFSRAHESWDLDEVVLVYAIGALVLPVFLARAMFKLRFAVEALKTAEAEAHEAANRDSLTGLFNRRHFMTILEMEVQKDQKPGFPVVILLDLNSFKAVNDLYGHLHGDCVLKEVAIRIVGCCCPEVNAARIGGDEFAILFRDEVDLRKAVSLARDLLEAITKPLNLNPGIDNIGVSIGVSIWKDGQKADELIRNADHAMYAAKREGEASLVVFGELLSQKLERLAQLKGELQLPETMQKIEPHFQPIFDLKNNRVIGFEVLSRWNSSGSGQIHPEEFIPLIEELGLIDVHTLYILRSALELGLDWEDRLFLSFNLSPLLFTKDVVKSIEEILNDLGFDANRIQFEITESSVIRNPRNAEQVLASLKALGASVALDDFGTGYSSLETLSKYPFNAIKIDKGFISAIDPKSQSNPIMSAILSLGESLDMVVTAEGIENAHELAFLKEQRCPCGQGFHLAPAMNASSVSRFLAEVKIGDRRELNLQPD